jgi:hypothetical protein
VYAARYPTSAVIDVDMVLDLRGFAELVRSLGSQLHGPEFPQLWEQFEHSMQLDRIPPEARELVHQSRRADQRLVLGYWAPLFEAPVAELLDRVDETLAAVSVPCAAIHGSELDMSIEVGYATACRKLLFTNGRTATIFPTSSTANALSKRCGPSSCIPQGFPHPRGDWKAAPGRDGAGWSCRGREHRCCGKEPRCALTKAT